MPLLLFARSGTVGFSGCELELLTRLLELLGGLAPVTAEDVTLEEAVAPIMVSAVESLSEQGGFLFSSGLAGCGFNEWELRFINFCSADAILD